ncbi:hypothetical protein E4U57_007043 [Claviceps arundinis]|uniref:Uncharacterized protein n=1 Tax=Claviceps arundinis TaxID=1623583 RepID=A0A9P7MK44_9HYPO|nr:hypothetical protein E4U57_007043 [Claviceps arundinis]KAG5955812.1 hypothetical protein E4U56_007016 [Claviceps arundinis]
MNNLVLNVAFSDDVCWIARILKAPVDPSYTRQHEVAMLSEIATMKTLKSRFPYLLLEGLKGKTLQSTMAKTVPVDYKHHVASQLADVLYQLENLTFDRLGRIWCGENCDEPPRIIP